MNRRRLIRLMKIKRSRIRLIRMKRRKDYCKREDASRED